MEEEKAGLTSRSVLDAAEIEARATQFVSYISMTEALTDRQATVIRYYISLHTAMIAAGGAVLVSAFSLVGVGPSIYLFAFVFLICVTGAYFCRIWRKTLTTLRFWERLKYKIIRETERERPELLELYAREWNDAGADALRFKEAARDRVLALPRIFAAFYWSVAVIVFLALIVQIDGQFFDGRLMSWLDAAVPGVRELLTGRASSP